MTGKVICKLVVRILRISFTHSEKWVQLQESATLLLFGGCPVGRAYSRAGQAFACDRRRWSVFFNHGLQDATDFFGKEKKETEGRETKVGKQR